MLCATASHSEETQSHATRTLVAELPAFSLLAIRNYRITDNGSSDVGVYAQGY